MDYDENKIDEMVLALLYLTMFKNHGEARAWKSHDWDAMDRLHQERIHLRSSKQGKVGRDDR